MAKTGKIIIATGGTGGHIFPARSLAKELSMKGCSVTIFANKNYVKYHEFTEDYDFSIISSAQIRKDPLALISAAFKICFGVLKSLFLMLVKKPDVIVAFGGYTTFPTLISAVILRKKIILHEQNAHLGKVNRIFAKYAFKIATSFRNTDAILSAFRKKAKYVGNPVRDEIISLSKEHYQYPNFNFHYKSENNMGYNLVLASDFEEIKKVKEEYFNILIIGGSGGAKIFSDVLPKALFNMRSDLKNNIFITQQCRHDLVEETYNQYKHFNLNVTLKTFFDDIGEQIKKAHLVISRSGASTIFELAIAKKPMILVPFANSADDHQLKNALEFEKGGGAVIVKEDEFTISNVGNLIEKMVDNPEILNAMSKGSSSVANVKATANLVKLVLQVS